MGRFSGYWGRRAAAFLVASILTIAGPAVATGSSLSSGSSGGPTVSGSSEFPQGTSSTPQERVDARLHEEVAAGNIAALVAEGHLVRLVELGYAEELVLAGFVDELVEIGYYDPALGIEESGVCPEVVVIAGRGSGQNFKLIPTRYSDTAPWVSNGREAETWRLFFRAVEEQYRRDHPGESLMEDVYVLGLDESLYPATHFRPEQGLSAAGSSAGQVVKDTAANFFDSLERGTEGVRAAVELVEETGCFPQYILAGYSQGAAALANAEKPLAQRGTLAGAIYLGNPLLERHSPWLIGQGAEGGGVLRWRGPSSDQLAATDNRLEYCLAGDLVCDLHLQSLPAGSSRLTGTHLDYFTDVPAHRADELQVTRNFAAWVDEVRLG
ncbi:cutinase family protein [Corynebacterium halotolerans]|uniref:cutinase family protein n=1 Tax=Corynebacterium halotolerans TaxID=225326 RepID=UPI003CF2E168